MDSLRFVERDNKKLYCFIEVCVKLFPKFSKSTVRSWLKVNDIPCATATLPEQTYFKQENPYLSGSFGLNDLRDLIDFRKSPCKRQFPYSSCETDSASNSATKKTKNSPQVSSSSNSKSQVCLVAYDNDSSDSSSDEHQIFPPQDISFISPGSATKSHASKQNLRSDSPFAEDHFSIREDSLGTSSASPHVEKCYDDEDFASPGDNDAKERSKYKLSKAEIPENLKCELTSVRRFYTRPINPKRQATNFSLSTTDKMLERILCFLYFCKNHRNIVQLTLSLYNDVTLFSKYVTYLRNVRKLMPSTIVATLTVAINVIKFNFCDDPTYLRNCSQILEYRTVQRQLAKEARILARQSKEGLTKKSTQQFYFAHILEVLRNLRTNYLESSGIKKARYLHDFVLLATYLRAMPGRSKEIRTLKLFLESAGNPFQHWEHVNGNSIVFHADKRVVLVQCAYKTAKSAGPTKIDITDDSELVNFLMKYVKARPTLLLGKIHNNFFVNCHGEPFPDSGAISKYLGDLFEREVAIRASTNMLRHSIVTYFKSIDESNDVNVRESLASLMKHSVRYQESVYNDMTHDEKTKKGRNLLRKKLALNVFGEEDEILELSDDNNSDASDSEEFGLKPNVGDICALLDPISTPTNIHFFLCKVARYTDDREEAHLMHLEPVEDSENLYKLKPGRVWTESTRTLIFPIDIVYNSSENAYELRTSREDIYKCVK